MSDLKAGLIPARKPAYRRCERSDSGLRNHGHGGKYEKEKIKKELANSKEHQTTNRPTSD